MGRGHFVQSCRQKIIFHYWWISRSSPQLIIWSINCQKLVENVHHSFSKDYSLSIFEHILWDLSHLYDMLCCHPALVVTQWWGTCYLDEKVLFTSLPSLPNQMHLAGDRKYIICTAYTACSAMKRDLVASARREVKVLSPAARRHSECRSVSKQRFDVCGWNCLNFDLWKLWTGDGTPAWESVSSGWDQSADWLNNI